MDKRSKIAKRAASAGANVAYKYFRTDLKVKTKGRKTDFVTRADHKAQEQVVEELQIIREGEQIVGEEHDLPSQFDATTPTWVVDPIDGTNNFVRGIPLWATSVSCVIDSEPVAAATVAPATDDVFVADDTHARHNGRCISVSERTDVEKCSVVPTLWWDYDSRDEYASVTKSITAQFGDLKRYGSTQSELALLAMGAVDGVVSNRQGPPWDTIAGVHLVRKAGGKVTDIHGEPWSHDSTGLVASNGSIHDAVLECVRF